MVLPTYLDIKEAAKHIQQKCREPVTPEWLLQHASEGKLQLFALVRDQDVCILTGAKPFGTGRMNTPERAPMSIMSHEVFDGDRIPFDALDQMIRVVHPVGSRAPLADVWASRLVANGKADIYTVSVDGERASVISSIYSNWRLHENGRIVGTAWPWKVRLDDLCFRSEDIDRLIDANPSAAATHPKPPTASTETKPVTAKVGGSDTASGGDDWQTKCRVIADELHAKDIAAGAWSSVSDIADRIAPIAVERKIRGPQGQLTAGNILREALQGDKWNNGRIKS